MLILSKWLAVKSRTLLKLIAAMKAKQKQRQLVPTLNWFALALICWCWRLCDVDGLELVVGIDVMQPFSFLDVFWKKNKLKFRSGTITNTYELTSSCSLLLFADVIGRALVLGWLRCLRQTHIKIGPCSEWTSVFSTWSWTCCVLFSDVTSGCSYFSCSYLASPLLQTLNLLNEFEIRVFSLCCWPSCSNPDQT